MDLIANLLTTLRNAEMAHHSQTVIRSTKLNLAILKVLQAKGFVASVEKGETGITVGLHKRTTAHHYKRVSKPGRRMYTDAAGIPTVLGGFGTVILSTSEGVIAGDEARKRHIGGEILCEVY